MYVCMYVQGMYVRVRGRNLDLRSVWRGGDAPGDRDEMEVSGYRKRNVHHGRGKKKQVLNKQTPNARRGSGSAARGR